MGAASSRRRGGAADYNRPGYVDALTTLLMVMIFLLSVLSVAQFSLSDALSNKDSAIDRLNKQVGDLANLLSVEKSASQGLRRDIERLDLQLQSTRSQRDRLGANLDSARQAA